MNIPAPKRVPDSFIAREGIPAPKSSSSYRIAAKWLEDNPEAPEGLKPHLDPLRNDLYIHPWNICANCESPTLKTFEPNLAESDSENNPLVELSREEFESRWDRVSDHWDCSRALTTVRKAAALRGQDCPQLMEGIIEGKTQGMISTEIGITQGAVSHRLAAIMRTAKWIAAVEKYNEIVLETLDTWWIQLYPNAKPGLQAIKEIWTLFAQYGRFRTVEDLMGYRQSEVATYNAKIRDVINLNNPKKLAIYQAGGHIPTGLTTEQIAEILPKDFIPGGIALKDGYKEARAAIARESVHSHPINHDLRKPHPRKKYCYATMRNNHAKKK